MFLESDQGDFLKEWEASTAKYLLYQGCRKLQKFGGGGVMNILNKN